LFTKTAGKATIQKKLKQTVSDYL